MDTQAEAGYAASWTIKGTCGEKTVTEAEWLACTDPTKLMKQFRELGSGRRLRLLAAAAVHQVEPLLSSDVCRLSLDLAIRLADENVPEVLQSEMRREAWEYIRVNAGTRPQASVNADTAAVKAIHSLPDEAVRMALWETAKALTRQRSADSRQWEEALIWSKGRLMPLVRDIFGNPFRPVTISSAILAWNNAVVVRLAQAAYEDRHLPAGTLDNTRLLILADALEEAGCTDADILGHLRGPGPHVRGCWVVDWCLGKS
jgi:hypothetical protein